MPKRSLNIISFNIPYPPDYGGVIDIFYKIKTLKELGFNIVLHCFEYNRKAAPELDKYCKKIYYYKRNIARSNLFSFKPYIVISRAANELLVNLCSNKFPILFEGIHSCYFLDSPKLKDRVKIVRTHNIEHHYYQSLAQSEINVFRKYYFYNEAYKLKNYEKILKHSSGIAAISENDRLYFASKYKNVKRISAFHPHQNIDIKTGKGTFALYHGSLSVSENNFAAMYLVNNIFNDIKDIPLIIAGNKASRELINAVDNAGSDIELRSDINTEQIYQLIREAQINILPTFQPTGIKLKLLAALFTGRHCIVNKYMVENTGLESLCTIANNDIEMKKVIRKYFNKTFTTEQIQQRQIVLKEKQFTNETNGVKLAEMLFA
ncbi:MAG: glycosyltransferase family 1 protein [Bacteroidales bacterium]|nr:glycosyltransferase family 1 protein [Bacteroidales bacterium]